MNPRLSERGEGRIGLFIALALLGAVVFVGMKIIPVRINSYEFLDFMREQARFGSAERDSKNIYDRVLKKAIDLDLPLDKKNLKVERTTTEMVISAKFEVPIDLKVTTYVYKFDHRERAPLF